MKSEASLRLKMDGYAGGLLLAVIGMAQAASGMPARTEAASWYFAISGDSRDCGDLIMPKIAADIEARRDKTPVEFYWHLGDLRRMSDIDCDILKRSSPAYDCRNRTTPLPPEAMDNYLATAWQDFIDQQIVPFGTLPFFVGMGNHELRAGRTRQDFERTFRQWLTQEPLAKQSHQDNLRQIPAELGAPYYHFVKNGVDFINLDNSQGSFEGQQLLWLTESAPG